MKSINAAATKTFLKLINGLGVGAGWTIDNGGPGIMAVNVTYLDYFPLGGGQSVERYAISHTHIQNGDACPDPDVEFVVIRLANEVKVCPVAIDHGAPFGYRRYVELDETTHLPARWNKKGQADLASFCGIWMRNIKQQQKL